MDYAETLDDALARVPGSYAAALVDVRAGAILANAVSDARFVRLLEMVAATAMELFRDENAQGDPLQDGAEVLVASDAYVHYLRVCNADVGLTLAMIAPGHTNFGTLLSRARSIPTPEQVAA